MAGKMELILTVWRILQKSWLEEKEQKPHFGTVQLQVPAGLPRDDVFVVGSRSLVQGRVYIHPSQCRCI